MAVISRGVIGFENRNPWPNSHPMSRKARSCSMSVGSGVRDRFCRDVAAGTRPVLDQHGLSQRPGERLGEHSRDAVRLAAGRKRNHKLDGAGRRPVGECRGRRTEKEQDKGGARDQPRILRAAVTSVIFFVYTVCTTSHRLASGAC